MSAEPSRQCPECGWTTTTSTVAPLRFRTSRVPLVTNAVILVAVIILFVFTAAHGPFSYGGAWPVELVPTCSMQELHNIARETPGRPTDAPSLVASLLSAEARTSLGCPGTSRIGVAAGPRPSEETLHLRFGFPFDWWYETTEIRYEDNAVARTPIRVQTTNQVWPPGVMPREYILPRSAWTWDGPILTHQPAPETTSGHIVTRRLSPIGVFMSLIPAIVVGRLIALILRRWTRFGRRRQSSCLAGLAAALTIMVTIAIGTRQSVLSGIPPEVLQPIAVTPPAGSTWSYPAFTDLPWSVAELAAKAPSDPKVAQVVLDTMRDQSHPSSHVLYVISRQESGIVDAKPGWFFDAAPYLPVVHYNVATYMRHPEFGHSEPVQWPQRFSVQFSGWSIWFGYASRIDQRSHQFTIDLREALVLAACWYALAWSIVSSLRQLATRSKAGRLARGLCPDCQYPLVPSREVVQD